MQSRGAGIFCYNVGRPSRVEAVTQRVKSRVFREKTRMNLQDQIGALEAGVDHLIQTARAPAAPSTAEPHADAQAQAETASLDVSATAAPATPAAEKPALHIGRPEKNVITVTLGGQTVALHPEEVGRLIEELANARASMTPEPPDGLAAGWRFVSTKNPAMVVQKQSNGDRLLVLRHTGHGWVPFTFSPDMAVQVYLLLTQRQARPAVPPA
jgi:hypothetical protein